MSKCQKCKIEIVDQAEHCPFCHCVLPRAEEEYTPMYPDASVIIRKGRSFENLVLFSTIVVLSVMFFLCIKVEPFWPAFVVCALVMGFGNVFLRYAVMGSSSYRVKVFTNCFLAIGVLVLIDYLTGQHGWSEDFVIPGFYILLDVSILILMIVNRRNWQSYILSQLVVMLLSFISIPFVFLGVIQYDFLTWIAVMFSSFCFLGTFILGDRRAREELKRRFHI